MSERLATAKAMAGLLERLVAAGEKAAGLGECNRDVKVILAAVEDLMEPDARLELIRRLEAN